MIYFHLGYPKAASSSLQKGVFDLHSQINYLGRIPMSNTGNSVLNSSRSQYIRSQKLQDFHNDLLAPEVNIEELKSTLADEIKNSTYPEKLSILSSEFITSVFFNYPNIDEKVDRIKLLGVDGVIIVIRNQAKLIESQYREHPFEPSDLVHGKSISLHDWIVASDKLEYSFLQALNYSWLIDKCIELFTKDKVLIIQFEELLSNPSLVASKLSSQLHLDSDETNKLLMNLPTENTGVSENYNKARVLKKKLLGAFPIANYLPKSVSDIIKRLLKNGNKQQLKMSKETVGFLNDYFKESNHRLHAEYGLELRKFSYPPYLTEE